MEAQKRWAAWAIAAIAAVVAATAVAMTSFSTDENGVDSVFQNHEAQFRQLFPDADPGLTGFERLMLEGESDGLELAYIVRRGGETLGYALKQTVQGYGGPIELMIGVEKNRTLRGIHVGGASFNETEGLGAKAKEPSFTEQFTGKMPPVTPGQNIDGISGATITTKAVTDGVNKAVERLNVLIGDPVPVQPEPTFERTALDGRTVNASVIGYGGPVLVRLTLDENDAISAVDIGSVRFQETAGVGSRVRDAAFANQLIGKKPPLTLDDDLDAISGATVSSQAVVDAINDAYAFLNQK